MILNINLNIDNFFINDKINNLDQVIINEIRKNKYITIPVLAKKLNKSSATIYRHLKYLCKMNILIRKESRKNGFWEIIE